MKRFLALVMTVMMLATCFATVATAAGNTAFTDVPEDAIALTAIKTLNQMTVINGYPDGTFGPDKNVTRAEFTAMLMRTLGLGGIGASHTNDLPFTDVDVNDSSINWAIPDINTAYAKGIINGYEDQTFRPNANVAYQEAIKMIVCTLGYVMSVEATPWYADYLSQAGRLGIIQTASSLGAPETPATRACIAQMLYDSLEVPVVENGNLTSKTILTDYLGYIKATGTIISDSTTSLTTPDVSLRDNEVLIDNGLAANDPNYQIKTYRTKNADLKNYIGYELEYYYKNNGTNIQDLALYLLKESKPLILTDDMIESTSSNATQIRYYESKQAQKESVAALNADNVVIYNGKLLGATAATSRFDVSLIPQVGSMELIDGDGDNKYDVIKIQDYTIYYVSSKLSADYSIIDEVTNKTGDDKKLILNVEDNASVTTIVDANGAEMSYSSISTGDIICLATSKNTNGGTVLRKAVVIKDTVKGSITSIKGSDVVSINGTDYRVSKAAPWLHGVGVAPALQDTGVFCKDINGDIVAYKKDAVVENVSYGYIMGVADVGTFAKEKALRILTGSGSIVDYSIENGVLVDGVPCTVDEALSALDISADLQNKDANTALGQYQQLIKFTNRTSVIDKIYTATSANAQTVEPNKLYLYNKVSGATKVKYNSNSQRLVADSAGVSIGVGNAIVLSIPSNRGLSTDYKKNSFGNVFKNGGEYYIEAFDVSSAGMAKVILCYGGNASSAASSTTPLSVISKDVINQRNTANQEDMLYMEGFRLAANDNKGNFTAWLSTESEWNNPDVGDIFRAGTDRDGFATIKTSHVIYSPSQNIARYGVAVEPLGSDFYNTEYAVIMGSVIAKDEENNIKVLPVKVGAKEAIADDSAAMTFTASSFSSAQMLLYDVKDGEVTVTATNEYQGVLASLVSYDAESDTDNKLKNPSKVIIYMAYGRIVMCAVLDDAE